MIKPSYCTIWDKSSIFRGDTLDGWSVLATIKKTGSPIVPMSVCAHIVNSRGRSVHRMEHTIEPDGRIVFARVDSSVTALWPAGTYAYDVEWTVAGGKTRTYLRGELTIIEDYSKCR